MAKPAMAKQRVLWTWIVGVVAAVFWIVGIGCGWRAVLMYDPERGIVAKANEFGQAAAAWWTPAAVLTLTVAVMGIGIAIIRHLVGPDDLEVAASPMLKALPAATDDGAASDDGADASGDEDLESTASGDAGDVGADVDVVDDADREDDSDADAGGQPSSPDAAS